MIECFGLEPVAQAARECMDFSGLFSKTRGANRHKTLRRVLGELLPSHPMVRSSGFAVPQLPHYSAWVDNPDSVLSGHGLKRAIAGATGPGQRGTGAGRRLERPGQQVQRANDRRNPALCVHARVRRKDIRSRPTSSSSRPCRAKPWPANGVPRGLRKYAAVIAGQEMGTKARSLESAAKGRYNQNHVLMIGDAPGDLRAAKANDALFYPIDPGDEETSWKRFHDEAMDRFFEWHIRRPNTRRPLIEEFDSHLPEKPPWAIRS